MNVFKRLLLLQIILVASLTAAAYDFIVDSVAYSVDVGDSTIAHVDKNYAMHKLLDHLDVPNQVTYEGNTYKVKSIFPDAFNGCKALTRLTVADGILYIGSNAFYGCNALESVVIGDSVYFIGAESFLRCSALKSLVWGKSISFIGVSAFAYCGLDSIDVPSWVTSLSEGVFNCSSLKWARLPEGMRSVPRYAFAYCKSLREVELPNSLKMIDNSAFAQSGLESVIIPDSVTTIAANAFTGCRQLRSVKLSKMLVGMNLWSFASCVSLESINLPESLRFVSEQCFMNCTSLRRVVFGDSITAIHDLAFRNCASLDTLVLPKTLTGIGQQAFEGCAGLKTIISKVSDINQLNLGYNVFNGVNHNNCVVYVPAKAINDYRNAKHWKEFKHILVWGDVTGDDNVDISDINTVINIMLGKSDQDNADVTGDGVVDIADVNAIINAMLGKE